MSFKENVYQQLSITDSFSGLTAESKKLWKSHGQRSLRMSFSRQLMKKICRSLQRPGIQTEYTGQRNRGRTHYQGNV